MNGWSGAGHRHGLDSAVLGSAGEIMGARNSVHFIYIHRYARNIVVVDYTMQQTVELSIICNRCHLSAYLQGALFRLIRGGATAAAAAA